MQCKRESYRFFVETMKRNGADAQSIHQHLVNAWAEEAPSLATIYRHFAKEEPSTEDQPRSGRPRTSITNDNIEAVRNLLADDRHVTVDEISGTLSISHGSAHSILRDSLNMSHVCSVWIPYDIGEFQKERRVEIAKEWLSAFETLEKRRIITTDEKCFFSDQPAQEDPIKSGWPKKNLVLKFRDELSQTRKHWSLWRSVLVAIFISKCFHKAKQ